MNSVVFAEEPPST
jgi:hypothetical protein